MNNVDVSVLSQYGGIGILAAVLIIGFRILLQTVLADKEKERERADRAEAALHAQHKYIQDTFIPAAIHMTDASKEMTDAAKTMIELITQMRFEKRM